MQQFFIVTVVSILAVAFACGLEEDPKKKNSKTNAIGENETSTTTTTLANNSTTTTTLNSSKPYAALSAITTNCNTETMDAFSSNVQTAIDATCGGGGCHNGSNGQINFNGTDSVNRTALLSHIDTTWSNDINDFITLMSGTGHSGGNQSTNLTPSEVNEWWAVEEATKAFEDNVQPAIESQCGNQYCHKSGDDNGNLTLDSGGSNMLANRERLLLKIASATFSGDAGEFFKKMKNETPHTGGDQSGNLTEMKLKTWLLKEADCN